MQTTDIMVVESDPVSDTSLIEQHEAILAKAGPWPPEAYEFVRHGLQDTARRVHEHMDALHEQDRHVTGQELCLGLRDFAINRFGLLAPMVLELWHIHRTEDFGRMVFALIEVGEMQRRPEDSLEDFCGVYDFREAFDERSLQSRIGEPQPS